MNRAQWETIEGRKFLMSEIYESSDFQYDLEWELWMQRHLNDFFWKCFYMLRLNAVSGDYLEFGCGSNVRSFRLALKYNRLEKANRRLFAFDSFQGLPEPSGVDVHPQWKKGAMAVSKKQFTELMSRYDAVENEDFICVEGFYEDTIGETRCGDYDISEVAFAHIDCDLYSSTMLALQFVLPAMKDGSILSFDDWFCFGGSPDRGEQKAFHEISGNYEKTHRFLPYQHFGWHGMSFIVQRL